MAHELEIPASLSEACELARQDHPSRPAVSNSAKRSGASTALTKGLRKDLLPILTAQEQRRTSAELSDL